MNRETTVLAKVLLKAVIQEMQVRFQQSPVTAMMYSTFLMLLLCFIFLVGHADDAMWKNYFWVFRYPEFWRNKSVNSENTCRILALCFDFLPSYFWLYSENSKIIPSTLFHGVLLWLPYRDCKRRVGQCCHTWIHTVCISKIHLRIIWQRNFSKRRNTANEINIHSII